MLNNLTRPKTFLLISFCSPFLVKTKFAWVVVSGEVVDVSVALPVAFPVILAEPIAVKALVIEACVAESGAILLLMISLICLIADLVSLIV